MKKLKISINVLALQGAVRATIKGEDCVVIRLTKSRAKPHQNGDQLVELVEKREYDGLSLLAHELATLRAKDMATINDLRKQLQDVPELLEALEMVAKILHDIDDAIITETLWVPGSENETLYERLTSVIAKAKGDS